MQPSIKTSPHNQTEFGADQQTLLKLCIAQSAGAVEYTDYTSAEG